MKKELMAAVLGKCQNCGRKVYAGEECVMEVIPIIEEPQVLFCQECCGVIDSVWLRGRTGSYRAGGE